MIESLKKLYSLFTRRNKLAFIVIILLTLVSAFLDLLGVGIIPAFVAVVANPERVMKYKYGKLVLDQLKTYTPAQVLVIGSIVLIAVFAVKNGFMIWNSYFQMRIMKNRQIDLSRRLFSAYMHAPYEYHLQKNTAELSRNINVEVANINSMVISPIISIMMSGMIIVLVFSMLLYMEPFVSTIVVLSIGLLVGLPLWFFQVRTKQYGQEALLHRRGLVQNINQGFGSLKEAKLANTESFFIESFLYRARRTAVAQTFQSIVSQASGFYLETISVTIMLLICITLVLRGQAVESIVPTLALFAVSLVRLKAAMSKFVSSINQLAFGIVSIAPVYEDLRALELQNTVSSKKRTTAWEFRDSIEVNDLSYRYPQTDVYALKDINLRLVKGSSVAFVGQTGAGKSTLVDVILGLLPPTDGSVMVDSRDIRENLRSWQANIGYVPQMIYLLDDSIRNNIALGIQGKDIVDGQLWKVIRLAQLEEFVLSLPEGVNTVVGERGVRISGGQRQRIGIARALYHNPAVLVLDEGTSALDNATEQAVISAVDALHGTRTIIMIAHRLSTVKNCDCIYMLRSGKLECSGSYESLLKESDQFKVLSGH